MNIVENTSKHNTILNGRFEQEALEKKKREAAQLRAKWAQHAERLADWTLATLCSRVDTYGVYYLGKDGQPKNCRAKADRGKGAPLPLTRDVLLAHWRGETTIGLYTTAPDDTVRCVVLDVDNHKKEIGKVGANSTFVRGVWDKCDSYGIKCIVSSSDDSGGYHVRIPFSEPIPFELARQFGLWLVGDFKGDVEVNPKGSVQGKGEECGNYVRLFLPKPGRYAYPELYVGQHKGKDKWLWSWQVDEIAEYLLSIKGNDPGLIPQAVHDFKIEPVVQPIRSMVLGNGLCVDSDPTEWSELARQCQGDFRTLDMIGLFESLRDREGRSLLRKRVHDTKAEVTCPLYELHGEDNRMGGAVVYNRDSRGAAAFKCQHASCEAVLRPTPTGGRNKLDLLGWVLKHHGPEVIDSQCEEVYNGDMGEQLLEMSRQAEEICGGAALSEPAQTAERAARAEKIIAPEPPAAEKIIATIPRQPLDRTAYLWRGNHAREVNVTEADRQRRAEAVHAAFDLLPRKGFLPDFLSAYLPTTDVSCRLLIGAALSAAASVFGRSVWVNNGGRDVYPFLWVALIAPSGERKSTAVNMVRRLLESDEVLRRRVGSGDTTWADMARVHGIPVARKDDGEWDWEAARQFARQQPTSWDKGVTTLALDEIGGWRKKIDQTYNAGLKEILTGAYEGFPDYQKSTLESAALVHRPTINIIGASTPIWLSSSLDFSDVDGGFWPRWTMFFSTGKDYKLPLCDKPDEPAVARLSEWTERMRARYGEVQLTPAAQDAYCVWVKKVECSERLSGWANRLANTLLKFATLFALTTRPEGDVDEPDVEAASQLLEVLLLDLENCVEELLPRSQEEADCQLVLRKLKAHLQEHSGESMPHQRLLKATRLASRRFNELVETLVGRGDVVRIPGAKAANGKSPLFYDLPQ